MQVSRSNILLFVGKLCHWSMARGGFVSWWSANIKGIKLIWMLWGENRKKWKGRQPPGVEPWTSLTWAAMLCHWATTAEQLPTLTILYMYCQEFGGNECLSCTPVSHSILPHNSSVRQDAQSIRDFMVLLGCPVFQCPNFLDFYFFRCPDFIGVFSYPTS